MKKTAYYMRVSTVQQDTKSQEADLTAHAAGKAAVWFTDKASGKTMERPGWRKLEAAIHRGEIETLVVWRLDRLGRTAKGLTALFSDLTERKVNLVSLRDGIDLNTTAGRLVANVMASVAQYETEVRAERVQAGQAAAKARGVKWGGSAKGRQLVVDDETIAAMREMRAEGKSVVKIAKVTKLSRPTVYRWLKPRL